MRFAVKAGMLFVALTMTAVAHGEVARDQSMDAFGQSVMSAMSDADEADLATLSTFYLERDMTPVWVDDEAPTERGRALLHLLEMSIFDGLDPDDYDIRAIRRLMESGRASELAELDLRLSFGLMEFLSDLGSGRTEPSSLDPELFVYPQDIDKGKAIRSAAEAKDIGVFVGGFRPRQVDYWRLKGVLANYRAMARHGGWSVIDEGPSLKRGDRSPRVLQLRHRLQREGDLPRVAESADSDDPELFDRALAGAVEKFQHRHGLELDGEVGPRTLSALNVPIEKRIEQMVLNLERRRWMTDDRHARYIQVNLADFHLRLIDQGKVVFDTPVVIGSLYNKTPVFTADMTYLVINPYWNVPTSIAGGKLLEKAKADPGYFHENGFDLFESWSADAEMLDSTAIDWSTLGPKDFGYKLRQRPGPNNALGRIKFILPNDFSIYLHDTPNRAHFDANQRNFSHGCIRVAEPEGLAEAILSGQSDWTMEAIENAASSGERQQVNLDNALPVEITYLTAWVDDNNRIHFREDVYKRDQILADALINTPDGFGQFADGISTEARLHDSEPGRATTAH